MASARPADPTVRRTAPSSVACRTVWWAEHMPPMPPARNNAAMSSPPAVDARDH
ncbi:hypothetical protein [Streptomyces mirabilis]|uniref:hypothetical protein n=1 Tax=Streptomyces mirabilis TaxID=68239 RepID=UPI0033B482D9